MKSDCQKFEEKLLLENESFEKQMEIIEGKFSSGLQLLVYGCRKSGTTLVQRLIDSGEMLCHSGETKIKSYSELKKLIDSRQAIGDERLGWFFQGGSSDGGGVTEVQKEWLTSKIYDVKSARDYIALNLLYFVNFSKLPGLRDNWSGFVIKEVGGRKEDVICEFLTAFPEGGVLQILRDPRFIASAIFRDRRSKGVKLSSAKVVLEILEAFRLTRDLLEEHRKRYSDQSYHTVIYENVVVDPKAFLKEFSIRYNPPAVPDALPTQHGINVVVGTASDKASAKKVFLRKEGWWEGLTVLEIFCIQIFSFVFRGLLNDLQYEKSIARNGFLVGVPLR